MKKTLLSFLIVGSLFAEDFINLQISDKTLMFEGQYKIISQKSFYFRGGYLVNYKNANFAYVGIKAESKIIETIFPTKFSIFLDFVSTKNNSAIPIGIGMDSYIGGISVPFFVRGEVEYAPKFLSFKKANKFIKCKVETVARFVKDIETFLGYRIISFDKNYNSALYLGVGFYF